MIQEGGSYRIEAAMMEALRPAMESMGMRPPDVANLVPKINLDTPIREMGMSLGLLLRRSGLFRWGPNERLVTFEKNGKLKAMLPERFCSWIEKHVEVVKSYKGKGDQTYDTKVSMGKDMAAKLLAVDELLREIPVIESAVKTRLPVRRSDGRVELCREGWDEEARLYCFNEIPFETDWSLARGQALIEDYCGEFLFADLQEAGVALWSNRSFLVHACAMIGVFARKLLPAGTVRPLVFYLANEQGSGKSLLVSMVLAGCFGYSSSTDLPMSAKGLNQEKFTALLETVAQSMKEFLWLDDVPPSVFSNSLNRFTTAASHTGRKYGGNDEMFEAVNVTQVFLTGNNIETSRDLMQRGMICELFLSMDSQTRPIKRRMTELWLYRPEVRAELLSALWALVKNWIEAGMKPGSYTHGRAADWAEMVGGVLESAGVVVDPFAIPELPMGGDRETEEWKALLIALADEAESVEGTEFEASGREIDMTKIVKMARDHHLLSDLVGSADDKPLKGGELKKLGRRLAKWRGREDMRSTSKRRFRFGKRKQASNWVYPIEWLDVATAADAPAPGATPAGEDEWPDAVVSGDEHASEEMLTSSDDDTYVAE